MPDFDALNPEIAGSLDMPEDRSGIRSVLSANTAAIPYPASAAPADQPQKPGVFKRMLMNFAQGVGETAAHEYFGDRDLQKQRIGIDQQQVDIQRQNAASLEAQRQADANYRNWMMEQQKQLITLPNGVQVPYGIAQKAFPELLKQGAITQRTQDILDSRETQAEANRQNQKSIAQMRLEAQSALAKFRVANSPSAHAGSLDGLGPSQWDALIEGLHEGTIKPADLGRAGALRAKLVADAKVKYPDLDLTKYNARNATAVDFAKGTSSNQIQSFRAFLGHANDLYDASSAFATTDSPYANKPLLELRRMAGGDASVSAYLAKIEPVQKEFQSFLLNNRALYESDRQDAERIMDQNSTPQQMQAAIKSFVHTAAIRLNSLNQKYKDTMGVNHPTMVDPGTRSLLTKFGQNNVISGDAPQQGTIVVSGPKGRFEIPVDKLPLYKQNGYIPVGGR